MNYGRKDWNWKGGCWWKFDFHTHTPASSDFREDEVTPKEWLLEFMKAEVDCVAITDHNSGEWIDSLKSELENLKSEEPELFRPLYIFPGFEISTSNGVHVLGIFPESFGSLKISTILGELGIHSDFGDSEKTSSKSIVDTIDIIHKNGGIFIPAHVDRPKGLFLQTPIAELKSCIKSENVFTIEVFDQSDDKPPVYLASKKKWPEILGSDTHNFTQIPDGHYPGSHFTWVKMSEPSLDGLKLALIDGDLSLIRSDCCKGNPNYHDHLVIEKLCVKDAYHIGRGNNFECSFNPWLNTIIGGRGTSKSTLLEFIRRCFLRENELPDNLIPGFKRYNLTLPLSSNP